MNEISVIVPVYNSSRYLQRCINSILKQSYRDFELILIDDGSTDDSGLICDNFASIDDRITVIHKINEGVSSARNLGIKISNCDYITFIDSDDWIEPLYLEKLLFEIKSSNCSIVICGGKDLDSTGKIVRTYSYSGEILSYKNSILYDWPYFTYVIHRMLIDKSIAKNTLFDISLTNGEDTLFLTKVLTKATKGIKFSSYIGYNYFINADGASQHKKYSKTKFSAILAYNYRLEYLIKSNVSVNRSWYDSFVLETYRLYSYIVRNPEFYDNQHANILFKFLRKYQKYSHVIGSGLKFRIKYSIMLSNRKLMEKELKNSELPLPHIMEN